MSRCIYLLYFHPASKFPGPRLAAVSNLWYAYHWIIGRWPWAVEDALKKYGDVVRVAPNELVFFSPQAVIDIHTAAIRNKELFVKTAFVDLGARDGGIVWERDPVKHREAAKRLSPAFSAKSIKEKDVKVHQHIDTFIQKMQMLGGKAAGVDIAKRQWTSWLAMDLSADVVYSRKMQQVENGKSSDLLNIIVATSFFATINQVSRKFPWLRPLMFLAVPPKTLGTLPRVFKANNQEAQARIDRRGQHKEPDYFAQMLPSGAAQPDARETRHLSQVALQLLIAGFEPIATRFYALVYYLVREPDAYDRLTSEIRSEFETYDDITPGRANLDFLNACINESFRLFTTTPTGSPRMSPGAMVDGIYVPKGVICQTSQFAASRSPRHFHEPLSYHPQRWLSPGAPGYDERFARDNLKAFFPFILGPRQCIGRESAWPQLRLFLAKVLWTFDLEKVGSRDLNLDHDLSVHSLWNKPELQVRFAPVVRT
ncbi:isotrichodermin C-15 hydroxylase [Xylariomycetidae sp. FL2044]|nr:isotrichodermin C-15 hydroxylase [Xylariomycetidae sp. FL2044]